MAQTFPAAMKEYDAHDVVELLGDFYTRDTETPLDPPVVKCLVKHSRGTQHTFIFSEDDNLEKLSTGSYRCSIQPRELKEDEPEGLWLYGFVADDPETVVQERIAGAEEFRFQVRKSDLTI